MTTEELFVYDIIETVKAHSVNQDTDINPRIVRNYLKTYRTKVLFDASNNGMTIQDECFQPLGNITLKRLSGLEYVCDMPKIARFGNNMGLRLEKNGRQIPVVGIQDYNSSKKSRLGKWHPKGKFQYNKLTLYLGMKANNTSNEFGESLGMQELNAFIDSFAIGNNNFPAKVFVEGSALLENPDDMPGYNWKTSQYPMPGELNCQYII